MPKLSKILIARADRGLGQMIFKFLIDQNWPPNQIISMVRATRRPIAMGMAGKGAKLCKGDYSDYNSLATSFEGIQTLMFTCLDYKKNRLAQHNTVIQAARECSVRHIVYTSFLRCAHKSKFVAIPDHFYTEEMLKKCGIPYTIFRNTFYADIIPFGMGDALMSGKWTYPAGNAKVNLVAKSDVAEALANVLRNPKEHVSKTYDITAGKSYNYLEIAEIVSQTVGRKIVYAPVGLDVYKEIERKAGLVPDDVEFYAGAAEIIADGHLDHVDLALEKLLGRKPKTLEEYFPIVFSRR